MNLLLPMFLHIGGAVVLVGIIKLLLAKSKEVVIRSMSSAGIQLLGDGLEKKSKAKILDKKPVTNPEVANQNNTTNNNYMQGGANRLPDMRGVGYDMAGGAMPQAGGGLSANAMVGVANIVGVANQMGNISNSFISAQQKIGDISQTGDNISNKTRKGSKSISQTATTLFNEYKGRRTTISQGGDSTNTLTGKTSISSAGSSTNYIYGQIGRLRFNSGDMHTETLHIKGASRTNSLFAQKLYAPKAKRIRIQELNSQGGKAGNSSRFSSRFSSRRNLRNEMRELDEEYAENGSNRRLRRPNVNINNIILQGKNGIAKHFTVKKGKNILNKETQNMINTEYIQEVDSKNSVPASEIMAAATRDNEVVAIPESAASGNEVAAMPESAASSNEVAAMPESAATRDNEVAAMPESAATSGNAIEIPDIALMTSNNAVMLSMLSAMMNKDSNASLPGKTVYNNSEIRQMAIKMMPNQSEGNIAQLPNLANELAKERISNKWKNNVGTRNMNSLNEMLSSGTAKQNFDKYIGEHWGDKIHAEPSEERMKEIREQAKENVRQRQDVPIEKMEEEEEKEIERIKKEDEDGRKEYFEGVTKMLILESPDPEVAENILGKTDADNLKNKMDSNKKEQLNEAITEVVKKRFEEHEKYMRRHGAGHSYNDIYGTRTNEMMQSNMVTAANQMEPQSSGTDASNTETQATPQIYMSKQAEEIAKETNEEN